MAATGSVTRKVRKDGTVAWQARIDLGKDSSGRRLRKTEEFRTRREATAALTAWRAAVATGRPVLAGAQTTGQYLAAWLEGKRGPLAESTWGDYHWWLRKHILPELGHVPLATLSAHQIERWRDGRTAAGLSGRSVTLALGILKQALHHAVVGARVLPYNPAEHVQPPRRKRKPGAVWQIDQVQRFLEAVRAHTLYPCWLLAITTGLRRGELAALRWDDLDLDRGLLFVHAAVQLGGETGARPKIDRPKSDAGIRTVTLDPTTRAALVEHGVKQAELAHLTPGWVDSGYLFTTAIGTRLHPDAISHKFRALADKAGMPHIRLHDLRRTSSSIALGAGAPIKAVSSRLGHSRIDLTLDVYTEVLAGQDRAVAESVAGAIFGARPPGVHPESEKPAD